MDFYVENDNKECNIYFGNTYVGNIEQHLEQNVNRNKQTQTKSFNTSSSQTDLQGLVNITSNIPELGDYG
jgi:hypothetical protein